LNILNQFGMGAKYRSEAHSTSQGFPIRGQVNGNLTQEEYESLPLGLNVQVKVFDLANSDDIEEYCSVRDQIANKKCVQLDRTKMVSEDGREIRIHLEWADIEGYVPKNIQRRM
jgi:hypothetical protein